VRLRRGKGLPGFRFDEAAGVARFELIVPGTHAKRRIRQTVKAATLEDATSRYHAWRRAKLSASPGLDSGGPMPTLAGYVETYWPLISLRLSAGTAGMERTILDKRVLPFFGSTPLDKINGALLRDFLGKLRRDGWEVRGPEGAVLRRGSYSSASINRTRGVLEKLLHDAVDREVLVVFPIRGKLAKDKETRLSLELSPSDLVRFLATFDDEEGYRARVARRRS
jgi:hypothetical protein